MTEDDDSSIDLPTEIIDAWNTIVTDHIEKAVDQLQAMELEAFKDSEDPPIRHIMIASVRLIEEAVTIAASAGCPKDLIDGAFAETLRKAFLGAPTCKCCGMVAWGHEDHDDTSQMN